MTATPGLPFTLATFALVIGVLVFIHEFGHYAMGRVFGVKADVFSIGFGRELFGWNDRRGTRWKVSVLPLGGFVKFAGDTNAASQPDPDAAAATPAERAVMFQSKPLWQRALIIAAGPITNFLFAIAVFAAFFAVNGQSFTPPVIAQVMPGTAAAAAGLHAGDRFVSLNGATVARFEDVMMTVGNNAGTPIATVIDRHGRQLAFDVTPRLIDEVDRFGNRSKRGLLGVSPGPPVFVARGPLEAVYYAVREVWATTGLIVDTIGQVVSGRRPLADMHGTIAIAKYSGEQASLGWRNLVWFAAVISINLGFVNLLPIPVLDGGHLLLYAVEAASRRSIGPRIMELAFASGFTALVSLMLVLTWNDLAALNVWKRLSGMLS